MCAFLSVCLYASFGRTAQRICTIIFGGGRASSGWFIVLYDLANKLFIGLLLNFVDDSIQKENIISIHVIRIK